MLTNDFLFFYYYYCTNKWLVQKPFLPNGPGGGIPEETPVCKSQDSEGLRSVQKMLQILEAGLGISVKIKASPS
jgi:hypothetical protein